MSTYNPEQAMEKGGHLKMAPIQRGAGLSNGLFILLWLLYVIFILKILHPWRMS